MTFLDSLPIKELNEITPIWIKLYVRSLGWEKVLDDPKSIAVYRDPSHIVEVHIPNIVGTPMYPLMLEEAIVQLSKYENRPPIDIMGDMPFQGPSDILKIRIADSETKYGTITVERAFELLQSVKGMFISTACTMYSKKTYYRRLWCRNSDDIIQSIRLGQPERGSYVAKIICPLALRGWEGQTGLDDFIGAFSRVSETETRLLTSYFMKSTDFIIRGIRNEDNYDVKRIFDREKDDPIVSANFCQALLDLEPLSDRDITSFKMSWAGGIKPKFDLPPIIDLLKDDFKPLPYIIDKLTPSEEEKEDEFVGKIFATREIDDMTPDKDTTTEFVLVCEYGDRLIRPKVLFSGDDRRIAFNATIQKYNVRITGKLRREKRTYRIDNARIARIK